MICTKCKMEKPIDRFGKDSRKTSGLKSICKDCDNRSKMDATYDASCIKVLPIDEFDAMPITNAALLLATKYGRDEGFIRRSLQACDNAGVTRNYFVTRYLLGNKDIPKNEAVDYQARVIAGLIKA